MTLESIGELVALVGFVIFLGNSFGRAQQRKSRKPLTGAWGLWLKYGDLAAFGLMLVGLFLMWRGK